MDNGGAEQNILGGPRSATPETAWDARRRSGKVKPRPSEVTVIASRSATRVPLFEILFMERCPEVYVERRTHP